MKSHLNKILKLDWDSEFFGINIGKLDYKDNINISQIRNDTEIKENFQLIYVFSDTILNLDLFSDTKLIYKKKVIEKEKITSTVELLESNYEIEQLYNLSFIAGEFSRFRCDPKFSSIQFISLYKTWIDNSINKKIASNIFIVKEQNMIKAFASFNHKQDIISIGLIAVEESSQNKGYGKSLLAKINNYALDNNVKTIVVETQKTNIKAMSFYEKNNYQILEQKYIYHLWL